MITHEEANELLASFALDAVADEEQEQLEAHLAECPRCRAELDGFAEVASALGNSVEPLPEGLWNSIALRLPERHDEERPPMPRLVRADDTGGDAAVAPAPATSIRQIAPARRRMATIAALAVSAAAAVAILSVSLVRADNHVSQLTSQAISGQPGDVVTALETPGHKVVDLDSSTKHVKLAQFVVDPDGRGYMVSSKLPALSSDHTYQLWGVVDGKPISLGLLGRNPTQATFTLASWQTASVLGITVEPSQGAVVPSQPMVALGTI
jgi:Anti-sigma-K factor rskA/Putative zinc-finger